MKKYNIAIVGATGAVGRTLLRLFTKEDFPIGDLTLLASSRSAGRRIEFCGDNLIVEETTEDSFHGIDIAFFCAGGSISKKYAKHAVEAGAVVIDNSSYFRLDPNVPLVVPEVNPEAVKNHKGIIANPNCSTIIMLLAVKPLLNISPIKRIIYSTYQAVSGAGNPAVSELEQQVRGYVEGSIPEAEILPTASAEKHYQMAFNVLPQVDVFAEDYYTKEEWKMVKESHKILGDNSIGITGTCVRVPVFWCHSESVNIQFERNVTRDEVIRVLNEAEGVEVCDDPANQIYPMPLDYYDRDEVFVGRIREDKTVLGGLNIWVVGNQLRKGAATNALQIAKLLIEQE
ncbi:aspartate-semialdehyde dehydrogenase [Clostridium sp. 'deep sea']|uniref:aspartate-semialdehyde dehydrogenase n=1 Tax=Clostridium sp. 'deep sea' TaxID=2779445 RepID=UPI001896958C|nr:aspartate-semialdehyde dehydrogenase [Clostridium sp. 'deep sea']QOR35661.1 aspartate-semialdehyde dehydrogenase [Clostridium sp. 'deep sea']